ncbi:MAG: hypothetical protein APF83_03460 [Lutibacter sp. BRH_c52]|nr:MAG: hypothetical protein APF83_03460 [Lutibacter sp. BRH_c52]
MLFAINHYFMFRNLECSFHLFNFCFFIGTAAACPPAGGSPLTIFLCFEIWNARFIRFYFKFYFLLATDVVTY